MLRSRSQQQLLTDPLNKQVSVSNTNTNTNTNNSTSSGNNTSNNMNGDISARRDAASMMMSMSHLMDAAAVHAAVQNLSLIHI